MAVLLALFTSITYGVSNYLGPRLARGTPPVVLLLVGQTCSLVLAAAIVAIGGEPPPAGSAILFGLLAGVGNACGLLLLYRAPGLGPLSVVIPLGSVGVAVPVAVGLLSGEDATAKQVFGSVLAITGVVLVSRRPSAKAADARFPEADRRKSVRLALISTVWFGIFLAAMKPAAEDGASWAVFISRISLVAILVVMAAKAAELARLRERNLLPLTVPGLLLFSGTLAYAAATRQGDLSVVSVVGSLFTVVTVGLAILLDRERLAPIAALGVTAAITGVVLLSAS